MRDSSGRTRSSHRPTGWCRCLIGSLVVLSSALVALPTTTSGAANARNPVVKVDRTSGPLGTYLVDANGRTLYVDIHDHRGHSSCGGACARQWPPLLLAVGVPRATAGMGVTGLGTIRRSDHRLQVTSHGMPLYRYRGDRHTGQAHGEGKGHVFFVAAPGGSSRSLQHTPSTPSAPTSAPTTTTQPPSSTTTPREMPPTTPTGAGTGASGSPPAPEPITTAPTVPATSPTTPPPTSPPTTVPSTTTVPSSGGVAF
jgi:predicted lipoprotein with Yx(FWY)xxD motif